MTLLWTRRYPGPSIQSLNKGEKMKARTVVAGVAVLGITLTACGEPQKVTGLRDDVKKVKAVKAVPEKFHYTSKQEKQYKTVCTSKKKGVCKSSKEVFTGYKTTKVKVVDKAGKPAKSAQYCVELDHVKDGDSYKDDVWFNVSSSAYYSAASKNEGTEIKDMKYNHEGC